MVFDEGLYNSRIQRSFYKKELCLELNDPVKILFIVYGIIVNVQPPDIFLQLRMDDVICNQAGCGMRRVFDGFERVIRCGSLKENLEPLPYSLSTSIVPIIR